MSAISRADFPRFHNTARNSRRHKFAPSSRRRGGYAIRRHRREYLECFALSDGSGQLYAQTPLAGLAGKAQVVAPETRGLSLDEALTSSASVSPKRAISRGASAPKRSRARTLTTIDKRTLLWKRLVELRRLFTSALTEAASCRRFARSRSSRRLRR